LPLLLPGIVCGHLEQALDIPEQRFRGAGWNGGMGVDAQRTQGQTAGQGGSIVGRQEGLVGGQGTNLNKLE